MSTTHEDAANATADPISSPDMTRPAVQRDDGTAVELVTFPPEDPANPRNWPLWRKWLIVAVIIPIDLSVSWGASGFSPGSMKFQKDFGVSTELGTLGLSMYVLGLAFGPMTLAPLSEYYGRSPIYIFSYAIFLLLIAGTALVHSLAGFYVLRVLSAFFASVTIANFGGTIADLWEPHETGLPMSLFLWAATFGSPSGYFLFSFVAQNRPWRHIFWALLGINGGFWVIMTLCLKETRHSVILLRRAKKERNRRGTDAIDVPPEMRQRGAKQLFSVALTRPFRFLFQEAIIIFGALFNGYLYGLSFLFNDAFSLVFGQHGHKFNTVGVGLCFLGIMFGISMGPVTNLWQERYYQRRIAKTGGKNTPEARVQLSQLAGVTLPISLFWFAWTSQHVHWIVPIIASSLWGWSFYTLILMTYMYTEDSYKVYSASALAGLGLIRNLAGAGFPLFANKMFEKLGYEWATSLLAFLAILLIPIPFIIAKKGRALRLRSPWAREHMDDILESEQQRKPHNES